MEAWQRNLRVIWIAQFIAMMGMSLVVPFLPFFIRELGVRDEVEVSRWSGLAFAGPFMVSLFMTPIWGWLGDRYGRRLMVIRAIFGLGIAQILVGLSQNVEQLFVFRMVQGLVSGFIAAALALVSVTAPKERTGYAIGVLQTATAGGTVLGPMVGGALADATGFRPIFFIVAGLCFISGVLIITKVKEVEKVPAGEANHSLLDNHRYAFASPQLKMGFVLILLSQIAIGLVQPIFALFVETLEVGKEYLATIAGVIFSTVGIFSMISSPWWGKRNDRKGYRKNLIAASAGGGLAYVLHALTHSVAPLVVLRAALGFCIGGIIPPLYSFISRHTDSSRRGAVMGIASSFYILANIIGPISGGYIGAQFGLRTAFVVSGSILFAVTIVVSRSFHDEMPAVEW
jgi:DHA1 family multidrug resistance protein-like MFS transporter